MSLATSRIVSALLLADESTSLDEIAEAVKDDTTPDGELFRIARAAQRKTEGALSELLIDRHGPGLRFVREDLSWARWSGRHWRRNADLDAQALVGDIVAELYNAAARAPGEDTRKSISNFAVRADSSRFQAGALALAQSHLALDGSQFDADPMALNVENGILRLDTGELIPHTADALCSRLAGTRFDPSADFPLWLAALDRWLAGDAQAIAFAQRFVGHLLEGLNTEKRLAILAGPGDTGKSTFIETLRALLGDYGVTISLATLLEPPRGRDGAHHSDDLAALAGRRAGFGAESMKGRKLDAARVKLLTGGDTIAARRIFGRSFEFSNRARLVLATNHLPKLDGTDDALASRLAILPFVTKIPEGDRDRTLPARLIGEVRSGGILNWALAGLRDFREQGLGSASVVSQATSAYLLREDLVGRFIVERCVTGSGLSVSRFNLSGAWMAFLRDEEELKPYDEPTVAPFYRELERRGFTPCRVAGEGRSAWERGYRGLELRPRDEGFA